MPYCERCASRHPDSFLAHWVGVVESHARSHRLMVFWDAADVPLHAGGSPVLSASLHKPHEQHTVTIEIEVSGQMARIHHAGKTWADRWPWVCEVVSPTALAHALSCAALGMVEVSGDEKQALVERGAWPGLEYYRRGEEIVMWCRACKRGMTSPCKVCNGTLFEPADYNFKRR